MTARAGGDASRLRRRTPPLLATTIRPPVSAHLFPLRWLHRVAVLPAIDDVATERRRSRPVARLQTSHTLVHLGVAEIKLNSCLAAMHITGNSASDTASNFPRRPGGGRAAPVVAGVPAGAV